MQFGMRKNCTANNLFVKTIFISDDGRVLFLKRLRRNDRDGRSIELGDMYFYYPLYLGYQGFISGTLERWEEWTDVGHWALLIVIASSGHSLTITTQKLRLNAYLSILGNVWGVREVQLQLPRLCPLLMSLRVNSDDDHHDLHTWDERCASNWIIMASPGKGSHTGSSCFASHGQYSKLCWWLWRNSGSIIFKCSSQLAKNWCLLDKQSKASSINTQ